MRAIKLFIATVTENEHQMIIAKSKAPYWHDLIASFQTVVFLCLMLELALLGFSRVLFVKHGIGIFGIFFCAGTVGQSPFILGNIFRLCRADIIVLDRDKGKLYWNGERAADFNEAVCVRVWQRHYLGTTVYRLSIILKGDRAFHLIETVYFNHMEQLRNSITYRDAFNIWPFGFWEPMDDVPTYGYDGEYGQFALARIIAKYLSVEIR